MDQMKIGAYLKELRKEKNLTQEQIAEKFGVSQRVERTASVTADGKCW